MVTHVQSNKLMPWTKHWLNLGIELEGVINIEVNPDSLLNV